MLRQDPTLGEETLIDRLNRGRVPGKPFIVTEWNYDSPNEYRCEGPLAMAAYGALQDWDGIICYCFYGNWGTPWDKVAEADELGMFLGSEEIFNDPSIICQFPAAAALFLRGDVRAAQHVVDIGYSATDTFFAQGSWGRDTAALAFLPFVHQTRHAYFGAADSGGSYSGDADLVIASGLSAAGSYEKAKRAILFCDNPASDRHSKQLGREQLVKTLYPQLRFENRADQRIEPRAGWPFEQLEIAMQPGMRVDSLPSDATALGIVATKDVCLGFINEKHLIAPNATTLAEAEPAWLYRLVTMTTKRWKLLAEGPTADRLVSDTGQLAWNAADGLLTIDTPRTAERGRIPGREDRATGRCANRRENAPLRDHAHQPRRAADPKIGPPLANGRSPEREYGPVPGGRSDHRACRRTRPGPSVGRTGRGRCRIGIPRRASCAVGRGPRRHGKAQTSFADNAGPTRTDDCDRQAEAQRCSTASNAGNRSLHEQVELTTLKRITYERQNLVCDGGDRALRMLPQRRGRTPHADRHRLAAGTVRRRLPDRPPGGQGRAAPAPSRAAGDRARARRAVGRKRQRLPQRVPGRQALPHVLQGLAPRRVEGQGEHRLASALLLLRRERRRHPLAQAGTGPARVPAARRRTTSSSPPTRSAS